MKPWEKHFGMKSQTHTNVVWHYFQRYLLDVFVDRDITESDELAQALYVAPKPCLPEHFPEEIREDISKLDSEGCAISETDKDLFDYYTNHVHQPLLLVGEYGYGKTTFLCHFINNVLPKTTVGKGCICVYLNFNLYPEDIATGKKTLEDVLTENVTHEINQFLSDEKFVDELWNFMAKNIKSYAPLAGQIRNFQAVVTDDSETDKFAANLHDTFQREECMEYLRGVLLFLHIQERRPILIVFDNIDILCPIHQADAIGLAHKLCALDRKEFRTVKPKVLDSVTGIKSVVAIRSTSIINLRKRHLAGLDIVVSIPRNRISKIVGNRLRHVANLEETKRLMEDLRREPLEFRGKKYLHSDVAKSLDCLQKSLVQEKNANVLDVLSNGSIRHSIAFASRFLCSHSIPDRYLTPALFSQYIDRELPEHLFLKAIILGDRPFYFERGEESLVNIVNVYRTACQEEAHEYTVAHRLLAYLAKATKDDRYISLLALAAFRDILYPCVNLDRLLRKWLHFGLVKSEEACIAAHFDQVKSICLTSAGRYYVTSLAQSLFYLQWIKDDCEVGEANIRSVVDTGGVASEQIDETLNFCDYFMSQETRELEKLETASAQRKAVFREYCGHSPCISYPMLSNIVREVTLIARRELSVGPQIPRAHELLERAKQLRKRMKGFVSGSI